MVANPARGQLNKENECCPLRLRIWSREIGSVVPSRASLFIVHTQAESGSSSWKLETRISSLRVNGQDFRSPTILALQYNHSNDAYNSQIK